MKEASRLGHGFRNHKEGRILHRIVKWIERGLTYEADPRQHGKLIQELGLDTQQGTPPVKGVAAPCVRVTADKVAEDAPIDRRR